MERRNFIKIAGISLAATLVGDSLFSLSKERKGQSINFPDDVTAIIDNQIVKLTGKDKKNWAYKDVVVNILETKNSKSIEIQAPKVNLSRVSLYWKISNKTSSAILNDHWERTYGDVSWHKPVELEILPWYFMEYDGKSTRGFGVKTGANAFCYWQITNGKLSLTLDTRSGGIGVQLGDRNLKAAEIVTIKNNPGESAFQTARRFAKIMCEKARMPKQPVYGINDWYFTYGDNTAKLILTHTELMAPMAEELDNRPFSVIDAGWFRFYGAPRDFSWGDMSRPNDKFLDMEILANEIKKIGMRPGIWTRPLCGSPRDSKSLMLPFNKARGQDEPVLDPSIPENLEKIKNYFKLYNDWGYELIKFDYTSFDIFGKWGFQMIKDGSVCIDNWSMNDKSKTNAEIILNLYKNIREAAGETYIIGCNTFSHLSAGLFELNRVGDDTSGNEWSRTRKMGVNTLAFRGVHHGAFYASDADCVGLTTKVPWEKNKQWMELIAKSGTPLFISAQPIAVGDEQKAVIKECFKLASKNLPLGEPIDWMENPVPKNWKLNGKIENFNWD